jgi:hypothetical protein
MPALPVLPHDPIGSLLFAFLAVAIGHRLRDAAPETVQRTGRGWSCQSGLGDDGLRSLQASVYDRAPVSGSRTRPRNRRRLCGRNDNFGRAGMGNSRGVGLAGWSRVACRGSRWIGLGSGRAVLGNGGGGLGPSHRARCRCHSVGTSPQVIANRPVSYIDQNQFNHDNREPKQPFPTHRHAPLGEANDYKNIGTLLRNRDLEDRATCVSLILEQ